MKTKINLFQNTVLRLDSNGKLHLMNHPEKGWASQSLPIASEEELLSKYNVVLGKWTVDKFGDVCPVIIVHNYWILFTAKGEIAIDEFGVAIKSDVNIEKWQNEWDHINPQDAPHIAIKYAPV